MSRQDTPRLPEYLTERQLADLLGVGVSTLQQWRYRGLGPHYVKVGPRLIRYARADVERWQMAQTVGTDERAPVTRPATSK